MFKVTARDQGHYEGPSGAFVTDCNISCLYVFCKFLMQENGFTASNICRQTNTSVALLYGQSMEVIGTRRQVLISFLSGKTHLSLSTLLI